MAIDFDEAFTEEEQKESNSQSIADLPNRSDSSVTDLADKIIRTQNEIENQAAALKGLQKRNAEELQKLEELQKQNAELVTFFKDHKQAIQISMYSTSKFVIEEEAKKAITEIKKVSEEGKKAINRIEDAALKAAKKASPKTKWFEILQIIQTIILLLIFLNLAS